MARVGNFSRWAAFLGSRIFVEARNGAVFPAFFVSGDLFPPVQQGVFQGFPVFPKGRPVVFSEITVFFGPNCCRLGFAANWGKSFFGAESTKFHVFGGRNSLAGQSRKRERAKSRISDFPSIAWRLIHVGACFFNRLFAIRAP
jgi:hypothetical protein